MAFEVNERGLEEIREILVKSHKAWFGMNPADVDAAAVYAYADDAESNEDGCFEIRQSQTVSGNPETFYISSVSIDV